MGSKIHQFAANFCEFASIDTEAGVVRGVAVISIGPALGHGIMVDMTTLEQVKACAEEYRNGLKVKMTHAGDAGDIVGYLTKFRIEGDKLLADLNLLRNSRHREYIMELAAVIPDTFGLSIAFSGPREDVGGTDFARCTEIYSADLVSEPAANATGLFDAGPLVKDESKSSLQSQPTKEMDETKIKEIIDAALSAALEPLSARLSKLETPPALNPDDEKKDEEKEMSKQTDLAEKAAEKALKLFAAQFGTAPAKASAEKETPSEKKFEELVAAKAAELGSKVQAIGFCVKSNPKEYSTYLSRVRAGEVITL